jgi:hypothetical protein
VTSPRIGELAGGGLVLGYACPSRCRHCLYGCGPHRKDGKPDSDQLELLLDLLASRASRAAYHIGGGEPFLDVALLRQAVRGMVERSLHLEYVETNAAWVRDQEQAEQQLAELAGEGLGCVLVSLSPFHAEFVAPERTIALIAAANRVLPGGAFVWIPDFFDELREGPPAERLDLSRMLDVRGDRWAISLASRYGLVPAGRAGRYLARHGHLSPWEELVARAPCRSRLTSTAHFHVDGQGRYVPGLCAGLVLPLSELPGPVDPARAPVVARLLAGGLGALLEHARDRGFEPLERYSAACDLCTHVRKQLYSVEPTPDLGPEGFYDDRSVSGYDD